MYTIVLNKLVLKRDFKKIPKGDQQRLLKTIHKKLTTHPEKFGKPLIKELKGFFRLRVDPYRVIYQIKRQEIIVYILQVGLRRDMAVYLKAAKRLGLI